MEDVKQKDLDAYKMYIEQCAKDNNTQLLAAHGELYMSTLMSVMLRYTKNIVRLYCHSFNGIFVINQSCWNALRTFLNEGKDIRILCDTNVDKDNMLMLLLRMEKEKRSRKDSIGVKLITNADRNKICESVAEEYYKFGVFDDNKFMVEYTPDEFKSFASFNRPDASKFLIKLFDAAFKNSKEIIL